MTLVRLAQIGEGLVANLESATEDWHLIFNTQALGVHVTPDAAVEVALAIPVEESLVVSTTAWCCEHNRHFPLRFEVALAEHLHGIR